MKITVITSTNGGVLSKLLTIDYFKNQIFEVISDRECGAINIAKNAGVPTCVLHSKNGEEFSERLLKHSTISEIDLYISFYTRLFSKKFLEQAKNKVINLHPSLLPACPGMHGFEDTIKSGCKFAGSTIHFVDEGMDTGKPLIQSVVPVDHNKSVAEIRHMIFNDQCKTLLQVIKWFEDKRVIIRDNDVIIDNGKFEHGNYSPGLDFDTAIQFNVPFPDQKAVVARLENQAPILDLRNRTNHPLSFQYSEIYSRALLNGKILHGRSQPGFGLGSDSPFVRGARKGLEHGVDKDGAVEAIKSVFDEYYTLVRPKSAAEWLGIDGQDHILTKYPPWAAVFPWRARSIESYQQAYEKAAISENRAIGVKLDISSGWLFCGPVSEQKSRAEAMRIHYVLKEIQKNGYQRWDTSEGDVNATALVNEKSEWRWLITGGNHRASAASVLQYEHIPIRVNLVIHRHHVKFWPHVVDGLFSEPEALKIFDNCFNATTPPIINAWLKLDEYKKDQKYGGQRND